MPRRNVEENTVRQGAHEALTQVMNRVETEVGSRFQAGPGISFGKINGEDGDSPGRKEISDHAHEAPVVVDTLEYEYAENEIVGLLDGLRRAIDPLEIEAVDTRITFVETKAFRPQGGDGRVFVRADRQDTRLWESLHEALGGIERESLLDVGPLDLSGEHLGRQRPQVVERPRVSPARPVVGDLVEAPTIRHGG